MKTFRMGPQAGLTLIEMVIAVSVIVLLLVLTTMGLNQDKQRAQSLEAKLQLVRAGVLRFQTDHLAGLQRYQR